MWKWSNHIKHLWLHVLSSPTTPLQQRLDITWPSHYSTSPDTWLGETLCCHAPESHQQAGLWVLCRGEGGSCHICHREEEVPHSLGRCSHGDTQRIDSLESVSQLLYFTFKTKDFIPVLVTWCCRCRGKMIYRSCVDAIKSSIELKLIWVNAYVVLEVAGGRGGHLLLETNTTACATDMTSALHRCIKIKQVKQLHSQIHPIYFTIQLQLSGIIISD